MKKQITRVDLTEEIKAALLKEQGFEEEISEEAFAEEKNKGKKLNKPFRTPGGPKKFSVYVKNEKGNVVKVNFGDPNMEIKRDNPERRKSFRARHNCDNPGPKTKAKYWSCKMWSKKPVSKVSSSEDHEEEILEMLDESESKQGLWDNIRKKKKREGKNYKPAKPGDKDRPSKEAYEKAQKPKKKSKAEDDKDAGLTEQQKKLPESVKKSILEKKKKSKAFETCDGCKTPKECSKAGKCKNSEAKKSKKKY
jgi:hypothetical protein